MKSVRRGIVPRACQDAVEMFVLCDHFGWTPKEIERQPYKRLLEFQVLIREIQRKEEEAMKAMR